MGWVILFFSRNVSSARNKAKITKSGATVINAWLKMVPVNNLPRLTQVSGNRIKKVIREIKTTEKNRIKEFFKYKVNFFLSSLNKYSRKIKPKKKIYKILATYLVKIANPNKVPDK